MSAYLQYEHAAIAADHLGMPQQEPVVPRMSIVSAIGSWVIVEVISDGMFGQHQLLDAACLCR